MEKEIAMNGSSQRGLALAIAATMVMTASSPSFAGPLLSSASSVKAAAADNVVDVYWRRGGGVAAGVAFGALAGAAIAAATAPRYYGYYPYGGYAYGAYPAYGYGYGAYATDPYYAGYRSYAYPGQTCGVYGGYGRWDYSNC